MHPIWVGGVIQPPAAVTVGTTLWMCRRLCGRGRLDSTSRPPDRTRMRTKYSFVISITAAVCAALWLWLRSAPWAEAIPPASPYPSLNQDAQPWVVQTSTLPALAGYKSPKPVVAADEKGIVVVVAHGVTDDPLGSDMLVWRSVDRGNSWSPPDNLTKRAKDGEFYFDPWLETDGRGHFYFVHALHSDGRPLIRRSKDAALTWSKPLPINAKFGDRPVLAVSPNGRRLAVAASMSEKTASYSSKPLDSNDPKLEEKLRAAFRHYAGVFVSTNHGESWETWPSPFGDQHAIPFSIVVDDTNRVAAAWIIEGGGSRSVVSVSEYQGRSWATTVLVESLQPDRPHPFNGERFPVLALDGASGLHVAYVSVGATALMVRRSADWKNWDDAASLASDAAEEVRMAAMDACGPMVHVTWMERIGASWHAYYRGSRDFGETWSTACRLSEAIVLSVSSIANGFQIYGDDDQSSVRDDGLGRVHAVWCIAGGSVVHAIVDWSSNPKNAGR